eukprot:10779229-Alexandrium_andersonii.AAC.1
MSCRSTAFRTSGAFSDSRSHANFLRLCHPHALDMGTLTWTMLGVWSTLVNVRSKVSGDIARQSSPAHSAGKRT